MATPDAATRALWQAQQDTYAAHRRAVSATVVQHYTDKYGKGHVK